MEVRRQGDIFFTINPEHSLVRVWGDGKVVERADSGKQAGKLVVAEGEVTGHAHTIEGEALMQRLTMDNGSFSLLLERPEYAEGVLVEGKVVEHMADGTTRFRQPDGNIIRFLDSEVDFKKQGVIPLHGFTLVRHDEHDAVPLPMGKHLITRQRAPGASNRDAVSATFRFVQD